MTLYICYILTFDSQLVWIFKTRCAAVFYCTQGTADMSLELCRKEKMWAPGKYIIMEVFDPRSQSGRVVRRVETSHHF